VAHIRRYKTSIGCDKKSKVKHPVPQGHKHYNVCTGEVRYQVRWIDPRDGKDKKETKTRLDDAREFMRTLDPSKDHAASKRTFDYYADAFLGLADGEGWKRRTVESHTHALLHARGYFSDRKVGQITASDCRSFRSWLASDECPTLRTQRSVAWVYQALSAVLALAVEDGALSANPAAAVRKRRKTNGARPRFEGRFLTSGEVETLAAELRPPYDTMVLFLAYTGLRAGELAGLNVGDLRLIRRTGDGLVGGVVSVERTRHLVKGEWLTDTPKSAKSLRKVRLLSDVAKELADYLSNVHPHGNKPDAPLFPHRKNGGLHPGELDWDQPVEPGSFYRNLFKPAVKDAGLIYTDADGKEHGVRLHDLRHTCASILLTAGMSPYQLSEQLGHASYQITLNVYARWIPDSDDAHPVEGKVVRPTKPQGKVVSIR
jgi:integrase